MNQAAHPMPTSDRVFWIDFIRASAAIMVIVLHAGSPYLSRPGRFPEWQWNTILAVEAWIQVSVPLFFMISGFLFLKKETVAFVRPIKRATAALLFYTAVAMVYNATLKDIPASETLNSFLYAKPFYHLWFFYPLIGVYAIFYFMKPRFELGWMGALAVLVVMCFIGSGTQSLFAHYINKSSRIFLDGTFIIYLLYAFLGFYLATTNGLSRRATVAVFCALIVNTAAIAIFTKEATTASGKTFTLYYQYQSPLVIIGSAMTFLLLREIAQLIIRTTYVRNAVTYISRFSLGIFGLHAFILDYLRFHTGLGLFSQDSLLHVLYMSAFTLVLSLTIARGLLFLDRWGPFVSNGHPAAPRKGLPSKVLAN
ncbi:acyltransferase family protein [Nitratireductor aquibiodomus]|uniref:acyltransferase n=1 Tax=Nitratireductor aquibiodomus TaxID=204799 RepID=UPI0019D36F35|nr:acyltransferase family protein [Nitratireductor aquibiodomus]MBN7762755.1 acyltransferase family protein [Nitratireductor aquibiodomus]